MCISGTNRTAHARYYRAKVQIKDYNVSIHSWKIFEQLIKNYRKTYDNIQKISICQ